MSDDRDLSARYQLIKAADVKNEYVNSLYGYWILPNGDLVILEESMTHGLVAGCIDAKILEETLKEHPSKNRNALSTLMDLQAVAQGWFRVSKVSFSGDLSCDWSKVTSQQKQTFIVLADSIDPDRDHDYWWSRGGPLSYKEILKEMERSNNE